MKSTQLLRSLFLGALTTGLSALPVQAQFQLLHAFGGGATDGSAPWWSSSVVASGATLYGVTANGGSANSGVLFKVNTNGSGFQVLHDFNGYVPGLNPTGSKANGATPYGTPILANGVLYGMTALGGSNGFGCVWQINVNGTGFQILRHFGNPLDGTMPNGSLVLDTGTLYGMTQNGGSNTAIGIVFKVDTNGANYQVIHHFDVGNNGPSTPFGSPVISAGMIYGTTRLGGALSQGAVWSMTTDGASFTNLHSFTGTANDGAQPNCTLVLDGTTLFGTTTSGGQNGVGTLFRIQTDGSDFQIMHHFAMTEAFNPYDSLIRDGTTLYGFTKAGVTNGLGGGAIYKINTDGNNYQRLYTFNFPVQNPDGQWPYGPPLKIGDILYGQTQAGGNFTSGNYQGTVFAFDLTGNGGGGGGGGGDPEPIHDIAVVSLKAPKKATLQEGNEPKPGKLSISIQNTGDFTETIANATALENLINLQIESFGICAEPMVTLVSPTTFPVVLAPKKKLTVSLLVTINCANNPLSGAGNEDYRYTVTLSTDDVPANDICPRAASGTDKGCAKGVTVFTDVIVK